MSKPDAPTPPNPQSTAQAQTGTNIGTAIANAWMNNMNQVGPDGSQTYNQTGTQQYTDPYTGQTYAIPQFTQTTTLSQAQQALKDQTDATKLNLGTAATTESGQLASTLANPFSLNGQPAAGDPSTISGVPKAQTSFDAGGPITTSYGPDNFSTDRQNVQDALMARLNPQLDLQQSRLQQQLADQGIRYGSDAYNNAFTPVNQQRNDAQLAVIGAAGQEQQRMMDEANQQATFQNAAQQQQYSQNLGGATFSNASLAQQLAQAQAAFGAQNTARNQSIQEQFAARNQPINEVTALMSGSQVSSPQFGQTPQSQIPTTDVAGITNQNFQNQQAVYQSQNQNYQALMGGILGLGAGALKASDRRVKENIDRIGTVFAASSKSGENKKLPIYEYSYKKDPDGTRHVGPMAQDVERVTPEAVTEIGGVKHIRPDQVMGSIMRAAS